MRQAICHRKNARQFEGVLRFLALLLVTIAAPLQASIVIDDTGSEVRLDRPAQRIVSLAPHITELLFSIGAGERIIATVEFSDYPEQARRIPQVGAHNRLDMERIVALQPDLIVAWQTGTSALAIERLQQLGFPVFLSEPRELEDIASNLERLGRLTGHDSEARQVARSLREGFDRLARQYRGVRPVSVFYQIWHQPLMTLNGEHLVSKLIELCGGRNVFARLTTLAPQVSREAVLTANPQAIIVSGKGAQDSSWLEQWRRWPGLRAANNENLFVIEPDIIQRYTPRVLQGTRLLCERLEQVRQRGGQGPG